jgi:hypothetical protein
VPWNQRYLPQAQIDTLLSLLSRRCAPISSCTLVSAEAVQPKAAGHRRYLPTGAGGPSCTDKYRARTLIRFKSDPEERELLGA